jgi:peroxiredoxin
LRARQPAFDAAGALLVYVSTGTPAMAADFAAKEGLGGAVLSDVGRKAFAAARFSRSPWKLLHPRFLANLWRSLRAGHKQTGVQGDPWQQGGVLVFGADGSLRHQQIDGAAGDLLDVDAIVAAAAAVTP